MDYKELVKKFEQNQYYTAQSLLDSWNKNSLKVHISRREKSILDYSCYNGWKELSWQLD